jgi:hypothetical protein
VLVLNKVDIIIISLKCNDMRLIKKIAVVVVNPSIMRSQRSPCLINAGLSLFKNKIYKNEKRCDKNLNYSDPKYLASKRSFIDCSRRQLFLSDAYRLASSALDRGFETRRLVKPKTIKFIGICCFSAKHAALRSKSKDWLSLNQNNVSEWSDMSKTL